MNAIVRQGPELRAFFGHARNDDDDWIDEAMRFTRAALELVYTLGPVRVVAGRDDFRTCVGDAPKGKAGRPAWAAWVHLVALGVLANGEPRYHGIIVPNEDVGRATAQIVALALTAKKPVLYFDHTTNCFHPVGAVEAPQDPNATWKRGWKMHRLQIDRRDPKRIS